MAEVKDPAAVAWVQYPAEELLYAEHAAKKKKILFKNSLCNRIASSGPSEAQAGLREFPILFPQHPQPLAHSG